MCEYCGKRTGHFGFCPFAGEEETDIQCVSCEAVLREGDEMYTNDLGEHLCTDCADEMSAEDLASFFGVQRETVEA